MKTTYYIRRQLGHHEIESKEWTKFNKELIQSEFDAMVMRAKEEEVVEFRKEDNKFFYPDMLRVQIRNGKPYTEHLVGNKWLWKPYNIKYER